MTYQNRFAPLGEDADGIPVPSRPEEFGMTECSDTESCELVRPSRRLRLTLEPIDTRATVQADFLSSVVKRVGPVDVVGEVPREFRRLRWSVFNVPLLWAAAAGDEPLMRDHPGPSIRAQPTLALQATCFTCSLCAAIRCRS